MIKVLGDNGTEDDWVCAIATKLMVSGFGRTRKEALERLKTCIRSTNRLRRGIGND